MSEERRQNNCCTDSTDTLPEDFTSRAGKFRLPLTFVRLQPLAAMRVLRHFLIFKCEYLVYESVFEYSAYSPFFEVVPEGCVVPTYDVLAADPEEPVELQVELISRSGNWFPDPVETTLDRELDNLQVIENWEVQGW